MCRATAARRPASGVAIIRQGPRSGSAVAEAAEAGRQRPGCRATAARRPASGVAIIRQGPRSGRAVAEAADEGRQRPGGDARLGGDISGRDGEDRASGLAEPCSTHPYGQGFCLKH
jgi:hypothetical protein